MTTGEWFCLISYAWAPLSCSERTESEKFKMKIYVSSGILTHACHSATGKSTLKTVRLRRLDDDLCFKLLMSYRIVGYKLIKSLLDNTCQIDCGYMCI